MPLTEAVLGGVLEKAAESFIASRKEAQLSRVSVDYREARGSLVSHIHSLRTWCETVTLLALLRNKKLRDSFVELSLDVGLTRGSMSRQRADTIRIDEIYSRESNAVILGGPGAGKTTSLQRIAQSAIADWDAGKGGVPILVRLRDLGKREPLSRHVLSLLGVDVRIPGHIPDDSRAMWERRVLLHYLDQISAVLLVDGLDETPYEVRASVELDLREIALYAGGHRLFLACRTAEYTVPLPNVEVYTILPLSPGQVREFAGRWLGERANAFVDAVQRNPYAGAEVVPLTLAHLCAIYERDGDLPPRPIDVYEQIVSLLVEEWDRQRNIVRTSRYSDFSWRKKERFLQAVAYHLAIRGQKGSFNERDLEVVYKEIAPEFQLPEDEAPEVIREVESHTGLILEVGHRRFDFVHLVIQEYLAAMYAHRRVNAVPYLMPNFPNEMALVIAHSVTPEEHLELALEVALDHFAGPSGAFLISFLARLAVERPTWRASSRLGWMVLGLLDLISRYFRKLDESDRLRLPVEALNILGEDAVAAAVELALAGAEVVEERFAFRVIPIQKRDVPPSLVRFLLNRNERGITLIRSEGAIADALGRHATSRIGVAGAMRNNR